MRLRIVRRLRLAATARFWGRTATRVGLITWLHEPAVRRYVNASASGDPNVWPMDFVTPTFGPIARALSLGCGDGTLERQLRQRGICDSVVGIDISPASLDVARRKAAEEQVERLEYRLADFNRLDLPERSVDAVFFNQSLHHVEDLERCLDNVAAALAPRGMLYLDEYVGPSRSEWNRALLRAADDVYRTLPKVVRRRRHLALPVDRFGDPSEAIRSSEILREVSRRFDVETRRDYGGTYLSVVYPHLDLSGLTDARRDEILEMIISAEREAIAAGAPAYYTIVVARAADRPGREGTKLDPTPAAV